MAERRHIKETFIILRTALASIEKELVAKLISNYDDLLRRARSDYGQLEVAYERAKLEYARFDLEPTAKNDPQRPEPTFELLAANNPIIQKIKDTDYVEVYISSQQEVLNHIKEVEDFLVDKKKVLVGSMNPQLRDGTSNMYAHPRFSELQSNPYADILDMFDRGRPRTDSMHSATRGLDRKSNHHSSAKMLPPSTTLHRNRYADLTKDSR